MKGLKVKIAADTSSFHGGVKSVNRGIASIAGKITALAPMIAGGVASIGAIGFAVKSVGEAASFETLQVQMEGLLGTSEAAAERMQELAKFAAKTPFQLTEIAQASKVLETLTGGAISTGDGLTLVGDVAANTGEPFKDLAVHIGRVYDALQNGRAVGESLLRLNELGVMSSATRSEIEALQKAGKKGDEVWSVAAKSFEKFGGSMKKMSGTLEGKFSTLKDNWAEVMRSFGLPIVDALKPMLDEAMKFLPQLAAMAKEIGATVATVIGSIINLFKSGDLSQVVKLSLIFAFKESVNFLVKSLVAGVASIGEVLKLIFGGTVEFISLTLLNPSFWATLTHILIGIGMRFAKAINEALPEFLQNKDFKIHVNEAIKFLDESASGSGKELIGQATKSLSAVGELASNVATKFSSVMDDTSNVADSTSEREELARLIASSIKTTTKQQDEERIAQAVPKPTEDPTTKPTAFSAIKAARGQAISSLATHGGGRGFKGAMSGLTKVALESQKHLAVIAANTGRPQQAIIGA